MIDPADRPFGEEDLDPDPLALFARWFAEAGAHGGFEAEAVALATADAGGVPSARMVLSKGFDERGFTFFSNYESRKARDLAANPRAALLFHWPEFGRQVRIEGPVAKVSREETLAYAESRGRSSQLSALASPQSLPVESREWLEQRVSELDEQHAGRAIPVKPDWGGYRLRPEAWEFWQHRLNRLHDRFRYLPDRVAAGGWRVDRLGP